MFDALVDDDNEPSLLNITTASPSFVSALSKLNSNLQMIIEQLPYILYRNVLMGIALFIEKDLWENVFCKKQFSLHKSIVQWELDINYVISLFKRNAMTKEDKIQVKIIFQRFAQPSLRTIN